MKLDIQLFAISKSTSFSESNLDVENNTSSLTITIYFSANNSVTYFSSEPLYCTCNGVTQSANVKHPKGGSVTKSFTFNNIQHNADGTKTVSWSWNCDTGTSVLGNVSASGTRKLTDLHTPPEISSYTITETNQDLVNAGVSNDLFVANLSKKSVNISYNLFDDSTLQRATAFNHTTAYSNTTLPILMDFTQNPLVLSPRIDTGVTKVPFLVRIEDSLNGLRFFTNTYGNFTSTPSSGEYRDFYNYILYIPVSFTSTTKARRVGQLSGQVSLSVDGVYYNDNIGNVNQGHSYSETEDTEFLANKNYYVKNTDGTAYILLELDVDYHIGDDIETYFTTVYEESNIYKPTIKYKYWKYGDSEPATYSNTIPAQNINVTNGTFSVNSYNIGSTTETDPNHFDPKYAWRIKLYVEDNFTNSESNELSITVGEATWTEYKDRVDFKKITIKGQQTGYYVGDTIELGSTTSNYYIANGYITSGTTKVFAIIHLPRKLIGITAITPKSIIVEARGNNGYLNSRSGFNEYADTSGYTITATQVEGDENSILLDITKSSAWTNVSNNTLVSLVGYFEFELS